jgi:hypothetical protein
MFGRAPTLWKVRRYNGSASFGKADRPQAPGREVAEKTASPSSSKQNRYSNHFYFQPSLGFQKGWR